MRRSSSKRAQRGSTRRVGALLVLTMTFGCYGYFPIDPGEVMPSDEVRVVLSNAASRRVAPTAVFQRSEILEGDLVELGEDSVAVLVWIGQAYRGTPFEQVHQTVTMPRGDVVRFERRALSKWRTALSAAGIVAVVAILAERTVFQEDPNRGGPGGPIDPPEPNPVIRR